MMLAIAACAVQAWASAFYVNTEFGMYWDAATSTWWATAPAADQAQASSTKLFELPDVTPISNGLLTPKYAVYTFTDANLDNMRIGGQGYTGGKQPNNAVDIANWFRSDLAAAKATVAANFTLKDSRVQRNANSILGGNSPSQTGSANGMYFLALMQNTSGGNTQDTAQGAMYVQNPWTVVFYLPDGSTPERVVVLHANGSKVTTDTSSGTPKDRGTNTSYDGSSGLVSQKHYPPWDKTYVVIDAKTGKPVKSYDAVPQGGWGYEYKSTNIVLRRIEPGSVTRDDKSKTITISKPYYIGVYEMTGAQFKNYMGYDPSGHAPHNLDRPVVGTGISLSGLTSSQGFLTKMTVSLGADCALPTQDQWEYACRAGATTPYWYGTTVDGTRQWYKGSTYPGGTIWAQAVGTAANDGNGYGLYDTLGNVWELTNDPGTTNVYMRGTSADCDAEWSDILKYADKPCDFYDGNLGFRLTVNPPTEGVAVQPNPGTGTALVSVEVAGEAISPTGDKYMVSTNTWADVKFTATGNYFFSDTLSKEATVTARTPTDPTVVSSPAVIEGTLVGDYTWYVLRGGEMSLLGTGTAVSNLTQQARLAVKSVGIAGGIKGIGDRFFKNCYNLTNVVNGADLVSFGTNTFYGCMSLEEISISNPDFNVSTITNAVVYQQALTPEGVPYVIPKVTVKGYQEMLYGKKELTDEWSLIGAPNVPMQDTEYNFFQIRLEKAN